MSDKPQRTLAFSILLASLAIMGPFSIDAYLPAFPAIGQSLRASALDVQQTLTAFFLPFGFMMLWYGTISDAVGRRPVVLAALVIYVAGSIGCVFAETITELWLYRGLQGLSSGAGVVVGRAMVRDRFDGAAAQRMTSQVMMIFSLGPAIAPIVGGYLFRWFGWQSIFVFLAAYGLLVLIVSWFLMPETLGMDRRQSLRPSSLASNYWRVGRHRNFRLLAFALSFNFAGLMLYIGAAPRFILDHLKLGPEDFAVLFVPSVMGLFLGSLAAGRMAGRVDQMKVAVIAYSVMFAAAAANVAYHALQPAALPWSILPIALYNAGLAMAIPNLTVLLLDIFPQIRGMAASCQSFTQVTMSALVAGVVAPLLFQDPFYLALGQAGFVLCGFLCWTRYRIGLKALQKAPQ